MLAAVAATIAFAGVLCAGECIARKVNRVGGISFLRLGNVQMSFCIVRPVTKRKLAQRIRFAVA